MGNKIDIKLNEDERKIKVLSSILYNKIYMLENIKYRINTENNKININSEINNKIEELINNIDDWSI